jgi:hypothetical protein
MFQFGYSVAAIDLEGSSKMIDTTMPGIEPLRSLFAQFDGRIEAALAAQDFCFSALTATPAGAEISFKTSGQTPQWRIALRLPPSQPSELHLRLGEADPPAAELMLRVDGVVISDLAMALVSAMEMIDSLRQD